MIDNCEHSKYQVTDLQFYFGSTAMPHGPSNGLVIIWLVKKHHQHLQKVLSEVYYSSMICLRPLPFLLTFLSMEGEHRKHAQCQWSHRWHFNEWYSYSNPLMIYLFVLFVITNMIKSNDVHGKWNKRSEKDKWIPQETKKENLAKL